jgi:surface antigen
MFKSITLATSLLLLGSCGNSTAVKTIGTLAGSSAGSAVGQAINAAGPWGYVAGIATTAAGGMAGNLVTRLFLPNTEKAVKESLISALDAPQTGKAVVWGTAKQPNMGIVSTTGDVFTSALGTTCRPFRITIGMPAAVAPEATPNALDKVSAATNKVESGAKAADKVASIGGESTAGVSDAAGTVGDAAGKAKQATAIMGDMGLMGGKPKIKESYGTACKDAKGAWVTAKV